MYIVPNEFPYEGGQSVKKIELPSTWVLFPRIRSGDPRRPIKTILSRSLAGTFPRQVLQGCSRCNLRSSPSPNHHGSTS